MKKVLKNKKKSLKLTTLGFTLIELLAVIIILAIVALIATPITLNVINDARISAGRSEAQMIYSGINNYCATEDMKYQLNNSYVRICTSGMNSNNVKDMVNLGNAEITDVGYDGNKLTSLVVESNNHTFTLCSNGSFAVDDETCDQIQGGNDDEETTNPENPSNPGTEEPEVPESISFASDSWETIAAVVDAGLADETYNVGDTKEVTLTGTYAGTYTVRVANTSTPAECSGTGFSQSACGFVVEFVDIITTERMNSSATSKGGWPASTLYDTVNNSIYNELPADLKNVIVSTSVVSSHGADDSSNFTSTDKLYLLSTKEIWGKEGTSTVVDYDTSDDYTRQLDYYESIGVTTNKNDWPGARKMYNGTFNYWWTRSANSSDSAIFYHVSNYGDWSNVSATISSGVAPAFRIG